MFIENIYTTYCSIFFIFSFFFCLAIFVFEYVILQLLIKQEKDIKNFDELKDAI